MACCVHDRPGPCLPGRLVSTAYTGADWGGFGGVLAGATAALTGLPAILNGGRSGGRPPADPPGGRRAVLAGPASLSAIFAGLVNAWVLLVEIKR
jgi:hypothetical protein